MASTPNVPLRIPPELVEAARERVGQDVPVSTLVRAGLAVLAGHPVADAMVVAQSRGVGRPRKSAEVTT